jgi:hypothetical protein
VAVASGADVALRVERLAAQRAWRPAAADHSVRPFHEGARRARRQPDAQQVRSILVGIVVVLGVDGVAVLVQAARLEEDPLGPDVPAERQRAGAERLVSGSSSGSSSRQARPALVGVPPARPGIRVGGTRAVRRGRDLDLRGRRSPRAALAGLQEERAVAGLADRPATKRPGGSKM